ncbi:MAG: TetR/AcrR family transcriptional regulator [Halopseudomonas sp.]
MNSKLKREAWVHEAMSALAEGGVASVKVEVLAKRLKVTKGSFYWHFKNRPALLEQLLESWREGRIQTIQRQVAGDESAHEILKELLRLYMDRSNPRGNAIELAVRDWARSDPAAAAVVSQVDEQRLISVASLYRPLSDSEEDAYARAYLFYSYIFGSSLLNTSSAELADEAQLRQLCAALLIR